MIETDAVAVERIVAGPWDQNCYLVSAAGDAVVVDPGGEAERIVERIAAARLRVHAVLATHGHYDHVGALTAVVEACGAQFGIHSDDLPTLSRVNLSRFAFHGLEPIEMPPVGLDLKGATALEFGHLEIGVLHAPGHTPGSVCFEVAGMLFTGDTLMATQIGSSDTREADPAALRASASRLARLYPADTAIFPGHGEPGRLGDVAAASEEPGSPA